MEKIRYEILQKNIPNVELVSITSQNWYDSNHNLFPWSGTTTAPKIDDIVYNVTGGTVTNGYYKWLGSTWTGITKTEAYEDFVLPICLENTINDLGVLVGWDGQIEQVEQLCNFTYNGCYKTEFTLISRSSYLYSINGTQFYDINDNIIQLNTNSNVWINDTSTNGPLNRCSIWPGTQKDPDIPLDIWVGFNYNLTGLTIGKTYYIGVAGDNEYRISIDGIIFKSTGIIPNDNLYKFWNIYPIIFNSSNVVLSIEGYNVSQSFPGNPGSIGIEIYDNTLNELTGSTSPNDLTIIYTTANNVGEFVDEGYICPNDIYGFTTLTVYNSVNPDKLRTIIDQEFKIEWGDGTSDTIGSETFSQLAHTYLTEGIYEVSIYMISDWTTQKLTKTITIPLNDPTIIDNEFGTMIYYPEWYDISGLTQNYLNGLDVYTGQTSGTTFTYVAIGGSKIDQKILYGETIPSGITTGMTESLIWSGYTIDDFYYRDYPDGYTMITGSTFGVPKEEIPNICLIRNEHFIGFIDEPTVYSDIFVERGKQSVMEKNLRLCEIDNTGELEIYGNGYFNIRKQ